jgi:gluconate 5-dehydrogenase
MTYEQADLTSPLEVSNLVAAVRAEFGQIETLVNIAGISLPPSEDGNDSARFADTLTTNTIAAYNLIQAVLPLFAEGGESSIINFTSINSTLGFPNNPGYVASKAALAGITRALALDLAPKGIRVNAIAPGYFPTDMTQASFSDPELHRIRASRNAMNRWGNLAELVGPAAFLASRAASFITGQELAVDGGWTVKGL